MTDEQEIGQAGTDADLVNEADETPEKPDNSDEPWLGEERNEEAATHGSP